MEELAKRIYFILVRTRFASNLGGAARVMKNLGFQHLILVSPVCQVGLEARAKSMGGSQILDQARFVSTLAETQKHCNTLIGTTARHHGDGLKTVDSRAMVQDLIPSLSSEARIGMVFGPEDNGLSRSEISMCHWRVQIGTALSCPSLNLAQAVGIIGYELSRQSSVGAEDTRGAESKELEYLVNRTLDMTKSLNLPSQVSFQRLAWRLRRIAARARLDKEDVRMLHGLIRQIERKVS